MMYGNGMGNGGLTLSEVMWTVYLTLFSFVSWCARYTSR